MSTVWVLTKDNFGEISILGVYDSKDSAVKKILSEVGDKYEIEDLEDEISIYRPFDEAAPDYIAREFEIEY